jgi:hypothetical protein
MYVTTLTELLRFVKLVLHKFYKGSLANRRLSQIGITEVVSLRPLHRPSFVEWRLKDG